MRRAGALTLLAVGWRITAACFDLDGKAYLFHRRQQIALHIMGKSFERRDIQRVQAFGDWLT